MARRWLSGALLSGVLLAGLVQVSHVACTRKSPPTPAPSSSAATTKHATWLGKWPGVEGTYLEIARDGERYAITVADLDGPKTYSGTAASDHIEFTRGGRTETIRAANGKETGMKWLADETDCLVITVGSEGFCRK